MDSRDTPDASEGVAVRVLLPDGGQMEPPEGGEGDDAEGSEAEEETTEAVEEVDQADEEGSDDETESPDETAESGEASDEEEATEEEAEPEAEGGEEPGAEAGGADEAPEGGEGEAESEREKAVSDEGARILHLNLDGLFLDLLGLEVDLDTVTLDVTAVTGESKLLGNLLAAVSELLGGDPLSKLLPDNPLSGLFGGGEGSEGDEEGSGMTPSMPSVSPVARAKELAGSIADAIRSAAREAGASFVAALPWEELLAEFLEAIVDQLLEPADGDGDRSEAEQAAASA